MTSAGSLLSIHIAPVGGAPVVALKEIAALEGVGLQGDRYAMKVGTYSRDPGSGRHVTLVEIEALQALRRDYGIALDPGLTRRNLVTGGVYLNHLVGREFFVGEVLLRGTRPCEPCAHMEKLTVKGALRGLIHRGGLRADIVKGGIIRVGDSIRSASEVRPS